MPGFASNDLRDQIRDASDIIEVIGSYIPLKSVGSTHKACCPFHKEKTPSFVVNAERQSFHCFGCGKGGDVYKFVMEYENVDFMSSMRLLAERAHIIIPERGEGRPEEAQSNALRKDRLYAICEHMASFYQMQLKRNPNSVVAVYLNTRALDDVTLDKFRIGAAPDGWDSALQYLRQQNFTDEEIALAGITTESEKNRGKFYDRFRNRLMFPITNEQGKVVAFSARKVLEDEGGGKYVNSPETPLFKKSRILYGFSIARKSIHNLQSVILCEGQLDVIAMHRAGFENTVAPQGTAFTAEQAAILRRQTDRIMLAFDADLAGQNAILKALEIVLTLDFDVKVIHFPGGKDPDELYRKEGADLIHKAVHEAEDFLAFLLRYFADQFDVETPAGKAKMANAIVPYIAKIENEIKLTTYCAALAKILRITESAVVSEIRTVRKGETPVPESVVRTAYEPEKQLSPCEKRIHVAEATLLRLMLEYELAAKAIATEIPPHMLSETDLGQAIDQMMVLTQNGDWLHRCSVIQNESHDRETTLSKYLVMEPLNFDNAKLERSISETIYHFKEAYFEREVEFSTLALGATMDLEKLKQLQFLQARLRAHRLTRHSLGEQRMIERAKRNENSLKEEENSI